MLAAPHMDLHAVLVRLAESVQLSPTKHGLATERYEALGRALCEDGSPFALRHPRVFAQGSMRIGTTVKPLPREEFDLDLVCHLMRFSRDIAATDVFAELHGFLSQHSHYRGMVEVRARCVRLVYQDDFHLDVLVARDGCSGSQLQVPDRDLGRWLDTDPEGFVGWFSERCRIAAVERAAHLQASIDPAPAYQALSEKFPLQVAVQLAKRARDIRFQDRPDLSPSSILLTTLLGNAYQGETDAAVAIAAMIRRVRSQLADHPGVPYVLHPTNPSEVLSGQWEKEPESFREFCRWLADLEAQWRRVQESYGLVEKDKELTALFGAAPVREAVRRLSESVREGAAAGTLRLSTAGSAPLVIGAMARSIPVPAHSFYGAT